MTGSFRNVEPSRNAYTDRWKQDILSWGADLVGVADTTAFGDYETLPPDLLDGFPRAVAVAVQLPTAVFEMISDEPTPIYAGVYRAANRMLDDIAFRVARGLQCEGFNSLPIPASQVLDRSRWRGAISHKAVARMAGLGWQGKSLLLITPAFGPRVRLVTILTDAPLVPDMPVNNRCGNCMLCRDACPVQAIKGVGTQDHFRDRNEAVYFSRCVENLVGRFAKLPEIGAPICGICIRVCPFGRRPFRGSTGSPQTS